MNIGVDLDNTIVCYDGLFHRVALERGWIPDDLATDKQSVRDYLRDDDRNDDWTTLQGMVYGTEMPRAQPFAGVIDFFAAALQRGWHLNIISHRTRKPYLGPDTDLHDAAFQWLAANMSDVGFGLPASHAFFEETLEGKLDRIRNSECDVFIDDLPEVLQHESFPAAVRRICFDPTSRSIDDLLERVASWDELNKLLCTEEER